MAELALETWNVSSLVGQEPELLLEVKRYQLHIVGLMSMHILGSGTNLTEVGWTLFHSEVALSERCTAGVELIIAPPQLTTCTLQFTPVDDEGCFCVQTRDGQIHRFELVIRERHLRCDCTGSFSVHLIQLPAKCAMYLS